MHWQWRQYQVYFHSRHQLSWHEVEVDNTSLKAFNTLLLDGKDIYDFHIFINNNWFVQSSWCCFFLCDTNSYVILGNASTIYSVDTKKLFVLLLCEKWRNGTKLNRMPLSCAIEQTFVAYEDGESCLSYVSERTNVNNMRLAVCYNTIHDHA
jgi:hypothetical protein